jgi:hypothetical protein
LSVTGSPISTSGTLAVTLATQNANTVFAGPTTGIAAAPTFRALVAGDIPDLSSIYQPLDADLTAIAALTGDGLLRKTAGVWAMDSASYLTANQTITLSGDVTGSGATSIATTIANAAVTFAKIQSIATGRLLGRTTASTGPIEEITPGANVLTWLQTPSSANLAAAITDETGSGALVFATSPTLVTPNIGVATGTSFNSITGLSSTTPSATVTTTAVVGTSTAAARADHVHSIADDAVTYAKMQDVSAASRLLGRGSAGGSGDVEEITVGGGIEFTSGAGIQTAALTGDVTKTAGGTSTTIANDAVTTAKILDGAVTPAKLSSVAQVLNFKNLLINGAMQISQRSTSETGRTVSGYYTADRWHMLIANPLLPSEGTWTQSIENDAPSGSEFRRSLKMTCTTANSTLDAGDQLVIQQRLEGQNLQAIRKGTSNANQLTLSFWVKSGTVTTGSDVFIVELQDNDNTRFVSASYTIDTVDTWEKKTITFPADTSGVLDNDNAFSLAVNFWLAAGSNFTGGTPLQTSWGTAINTRATGQVDLSAGAVAATNYWQITGVQLERGPTATEFEVRPYNLELKLCQYYYYMHARDVGSFVTFGTYYNGIIIAAIFFPGPMRTKPTRQQPAQPTPAVDFFSMSSATALVDVFPDFNGQANQTTTQMVLAATVGVAGNDGDAGFITCNTADSFIAFSAEL